MCSKPALKKHQSDHRAARKIFIDQCFWLSAVAVEEPFIRGQSIAPIQWPLTGALT
jgi:hypothetical protein